ncbi:uncharacterized protein RJT20DRAFT_42165 [Scheffersomyces xylosifermentans]|uniref:uncharacterized protein n=1 Tax=Scheffersomyces xylosifermentans TaxID=1304137 RepID=UPI00315CDAC4
MSSLHNEIKAITSSNDKNDYIKLGELNHYLTQHNISQLSLPIPEIDEAYNIILVLFQIEIILAHGNEYSELETLFRTASTSPYLKNIINSTFIPRENYKELYIKVKYNDLLTDYQYLVQTPSNRKLIDVINKKMLIVNYMPLNDEIYASLTKLLNLKILELCIISSYDFRKQNTLEYLSKNLSLEKDEYSHELVQLVQLLQSNRIIPRNLWLNVITSDLHNNYQLIISKHLDPKQLVVSWLENNIVILTKYYTTIKIDKIYRLFDLEQDINVQQVALDMIIHKKLPPNSRIDQINGILVFGEIEANPEVSKIARTGGNSINDLNEHISDIGQIMNDICFKLQA